MSSHYDTLVLGGGLSGLLITHRLHSAGQRVALIEARETLGGSSRRQSTVDFFPATQDSLDLLEWTRSVSPLPLHLDVREHRPQLFDEGKWRNFSGFGETHFSSVDQLMHFSHTHEVHVEPALEQLVRSLSEQLPVAANTRSEITSIKIADGRVSEVVINGDKSLTAEQVIFTAHPALLNDLIEGEGLPAKHRTRFAKMQGWTSVTLELQNATPLAEDSAIRMFSHNAKEFEPVVGRVNGTQSLWMTLVPAEREGEHEFIGQCIRHIKRQLKRAWPEALDGQKEEKIYVQSNAYGQYALKTKDPLRLPEIQNLYLANHILGTSPGALGSLETARTVITALTNAPTASAAAASAPETV
ncbi:MAG: NAD(P)-binding protein [Bdellovibrionales bacterium]|nr:NAD(P)-binding protein [Bdellovibrionales bacterium]